MSTTWRGSRLVLALTVLALVDVAVETRAQDTVDVRPAIARWCIEQLGPQARVSVDVHTVRAGGAPIDGAEPEPGARFGRPARFRLIAEGRVVGHAVATVTGTVPHLRVVRPIAAGAPLAAGDVAIVDEDPGQVLLEPLPGAAVVDVATAARRLAAGEAVTASALRLPQAVRSGQVVGVVARVGDVVAHGKATAVQSGVVGDTIRLVNVESRRQLRGRIVAPGQVEVLHGF